MYFHTSITPGGVDVSVDFDVELDLSAERAEALDREIQSAVELVLRPYFV
jgi:hypothetical protein